MIVEGLYILSSIWKDIAQEFDAKYFIQGDFSLIEPQLIARHMKQSQYQIDRSESWVFNLQVSIFRNTSVFG